MNQSRKVKQAIAKYGEQVCRDCYRLNSEIGEGANTIGFYKGLTTRQADAAIDAGRWLSEQQERFHGDSEVNNSRAASAFDAFRMAGGFDA